MSFRGKLQVKSGMKIVLLDELCSLVFSFCALDEKYRETLHYQARRGHPERLWHVLKKIVIKIKQKGTVHITIRDLSCLHSQQVPWHPHRHLWCHAPLRLLIVLNTNETVICWFAQKAEQISWYNFLLRRTDAAGHIFIRMGNSVLWKVKKNMRWTCVDRSGVKPEQQKVYFVFINTSLKVILEMSSSLACYWQLL